MRINILGKVGYFEEIEKGFLFAKEQINQNSDEELEKELMFSKEKAQEDWLRLVRFNSKRLMRKHFIFRNQVGARMQNLLMNFRWGLKIKGGESLFEALRNDRKLAYAIKSHKILSGPDMDLASILHISKIRSGSQELTNFPAAVAKAIWEHYCPVEKGKLLDMCAGFGGRMCGAVASKFSFDYTGVDPSIRVNEKLNRLIDFLNVRERTRVVNKPFEDCENEWPDDSFDLAFTSPPYFDKEQYAEESTQSHVRFPKIDVWREGFLRKSFEIVRRKLKPDCLMLINVDDVKSGKEFYPLTTIVVQVAHEVGFEYIGMDKMLIGNRFMSLKTQNVQFRKLNYEPIFKFINRKAVLTSGKVVQSGERKEAGDEK